MFWVSGFIFWVSGLIFLVSGLILWVSGRAGGLRADLCNIDGTSLERRNVNIIVVMRLPSLQIVFMPGGFLRRFCMRWRSVDPSSFHLEPIARVRPCK